MLLKIIHETNLSYTDAVSETVMELRMAPRQEQDQHRLSFSLAIGPPTAVTSYFDWLGNMVHAFTITPLHRQLRIVASSVVQTGGENRDPLELPDRWPAEPSADHALYDYRQFGGAVVDTPLLHELVAMLLPTPGMALGQLAISMLKLIDEKFTYETGVTNATSPITEILQLRRGVCQDFTHLMIGMARALGIPARYVSGFVHPEGTRYRGYAQTHAWCEVFFPSTGWVGFDPTNNCLATNNFVRVAVGRDYRDVPPNKGVYRGNALESMEVLVQSEQLTLVPMGLHAERIESLNVATQNGISVSREAVNQQEIQQQQQQQRIS